MYFDRVARRCRCWSPDIDLRASANRRTLSAAVYLTSIYVDDDEAARFAEAYRATGKRLDMGKSCVRFKRIEDLPLDLIGATIASMPVDEFVSLAELRKSR